LIDAYHALGAHEVDAAKRVAHQQPRRRLVSGVHRVLEIEDHGVGAVQAGVDHELGLRARQVES